MILDYKFDRKLKERPYRSRGRVRIYFATSILAGVLVALGLHDTEATLTTGEESVSATLPLEELSRDEVAERITTPLAIPGQSDSAGPAVSVAPQASADAHPLSRPSLLQPDSGAAGIAEEATALQTSPDAIQPPGNTDSNPRGATPSASQSIDRNPEVATAPAALTETESAPTWKTHRIAKGETLSGIFQEYELTPATLYRVLNSGKEAKTLSRIRPGQELKLLIDPKGGLQQLKFAKSRVENLLVTRSDEGFQVRLDNRKIERKTANVTGTIESSLFLDGKNAGLSDAKIMELAEIFGWDIDFALQIRAGDQFRVIYDEQFVDGEKFDDGPILAAEFVNQGKTYQAFRYEIDGQNGYYDAEGRNKRRAFIRTPVKFARISSRFTPKRWHPILKRWKSHKGVDYAAPTGTPIKTTGNGRVVFRGWQNGYGRIVIIQHNNKYKTAYAHMSKFRSSIKKGSRVKQGQVIGYVGRSGWATGPHLHYEFRVNDVQRNPLTVDLPKSLPLPKKQLASFKREITPLTQRLASIRQATLVARAGN